MISRVGILSVAALAGILLSVLHAHNTASAAACEDVSGYGAIDMTLPTLPGADMHAVWVRLQSPTGKAKVLAEINQVNCFEVTGAGLTPDQWSWQTYRQSGVVAPVKFPKLEGNTLRIIGVESGVKVDRVLITRSDCIPLEFGDNCSDAAQAINALSQSTTIAMLPPPSNDAVAGKIILSTTPELHSSRLKNVSYSVHGQTLQTSAVNEPFDTTLVANGKHTVNITTTLINGSVIREQTVIEVDNPETPFSPFVRWVRLHTGTIKTVGIAAGTLLITTLLYSWFRRWYMRHRNRSFHGL